jgi:hypothetical protein
MVTGATRAHLHHTIVVAQRSPLEPTAHCPPLPAHHLWEARNFVFLLLSDHHHHHRPSGVNTHGALPKDPAHPETSHTPIALPAPYRAARHALDALDAFAPSRYNLEDPSDLLTPVTVRRWCPSPVPILFLPFVSYCFCFCLGHPPSLRPSIRPSSTDTSWITLLILRAVAQQATAVLRPHSSLGNCFSSESSAHASGH